MNRDNIVISLDNKDGEARGYSTPKNFIHDSLEKEANREMPNSSGEEANRENIKTPKGRRDEQKVLFSGQTL